MIWSVAVLIVGIVMMAVGFSLNLINSKSKNDINRIRIAIDANEKRIQILERQSDVIVNELQHISKQMDTLLKNNRSKEG